MSLYVQKRRERPYLYFQSGRNGLMYLGPLEKPKAENIIEAMKRTAKLIENSQEVTLHYKDTMQKLETFLIQIETKETKSVLNTKNK